MRHRSHFFVLWACTAPRLGLGALLLAVSSLAHAGTGGCEGLFTANRRSGIDLYEYDAARVAARRIAAYESSDNERMMYASPVCVGGKRYLAVAGEYMREVSTRAHLVLRGEDGSTARNANRNGVNDLIVAGDIISIFSTKARPANNGKRGLAGMELMVTQYRAPSLAEIGKTYAPAVGTPMHMGCDIYAFAPDEAWSPLPGKVLPPLHSCGSRASDAGQRMVFQHNGACGAFAIHVQTTVDPLKLALLKCTAGSRKLLGTLAMKQPPTDVTPANFGLISPDIGLFTQGGRAVVFDLRAEKILADVTQPQATFSSAMVIGQSVLLQFRRHVGAETRSGKSFFMIEALSGKEVAGFTKEYPHILMDVVLISTDTKAFSQMHKMLPLPAPWPPDLGASGHLN